MMCNKCAKTVGLCVMSTGACKNCGVDVLTGHVPAYCLCEECAKNHGKCQQCGEDIMSLAHMRDQLIKLIKRYDNKIKSIDELMSKNDFSEMTESYYDGLIEGLETAIHDIEDLRNGLDVG